MKYIWILLVGLLMSCQKSAIEEQLIDSPWWCLKQLQKDGVVVAITKADHGFSYRDGTISGGLAVNSFSGRLIVSGDGKIKFENIAITSKGSPDSVLMDEETVIQNSIFQTTQMSFNNDNLILENPQQGIKITYASCENPAIRKLQSVVWRLDSVKHGENITAFSDPKPTFSFGKRNDEFIYDVSGKLGNISYEGKIKTKDYGPLVWTAFKTTGKKMTDGEKAFVNSLQNINNFEFVGDEQMFLMNRNKNIQISFQASK